MTLKTLDNALEILSYFTKEHPAWGVRELAKKMEKSHSIVHRILATYEEHGFLFRNPDTKKYELGFKFFEYGLIIQEKLQFKDMIEPFMEELSKTTGESVFLYWLDGKDGVCISIAESQRSIKFAVTIGSRTPLYAGASCKVILAYLPEETQEQIIKQGLEQITEKTMTNSEQLKNELAEIREQGWSYTVGEYTDDVVGVGVPIFNHNNQIVASLTIAAPSYRVSEDVAFEILEHLKRTNDKIQKRMITYKLSQHMNTI